MTRPVVLTFSRYFLPGYKGGGPIRTIANMAEALGDEIDFRIVTSDRDARDISAYPNVEVDKWNDVGKAQVLYLSPRSKNLSNISNILKNIRYDVLCLNSFFDPDFTIKPLLVRF